MGRSGNRNAGHGKTGGGTTGGHETGGRNIGGQRARLGYAVPFVLMLALALFLSSQPYPAQSLSPWLSSDAVSERLAGWLDGVRFAWNGQEMSVQNMG